jgi:hypothetical protein
VVFKWSQNTKDPGYEVVKTLAAAYPENTSYKAPGLTYPIETCIFI